MYSSKNVLIKWAATRENLSWDVANNTGADQPAHPRSLISAYVIRFLESIICILSTGEISFFQLVSVAEETGLKLALSETPKTGFLATCSNGITYCATAFIFSDIIYNAS